MSTGVSIFSCSVLRIVCSCLTNGVRAIRPSKVTNRFLLVEVEVDGRGGVDVVVLVDGDDLVDARVFAAALPQQGGDLLGLEGAGLQVDDVDALGRVAHRLLGGDVHAQVGDARGDQDRIVVADAVHGARAQPGHEARQPVLALDPRRPAELVVAERDAREGREEVVAHALADHLLDHDAHLLVEVEQPALGAVLDGVGAEDGGVHLGDGVGQRVQPLLLACPGWPGTGSCTSRRRPCPCGLPGGWSCARSAACRPGRRGPWTGP